MRDRITHQGQQGIFARIRENDLLLLYLGLDARLQGVGMHYDDLESLRVYDIAVISILLNEATTGKEKKAT